MEQFIPYLFVFLWGIMIGSFLNVCILRIPKGESIVWGRSHCVSCGYTLQLQDLIPVFSWLFLRGRCRRCGQKISVQYPLIEGLNGVLYLFVYGKYGVSITTLLYCLLCSALLVMSVIDFRTYLIPNGLVLFLFGLGVVRLLTDWEHGVVYGLGLFCVSVPLEGIRLLTKGRGMGGGDVKLMAACGLLLGWQLTVFAFFVGCILGSVIHLLRMRLSGEQHILAFGPYLAGGLLIAILVGEWMIQGYQQILLSLSCFCIF